jgi:hypothetical protein
VRVVVLSDTHIRPGSRRRLPAAAYTLLDGADAVLHAGDVVDASVLDELSGFAPVHAVLGNNDHGLDLPETLELSLGGVAVAMIHDSGPSKGRSGRLRRRFPGAAVVVFGHSHIPWDEEGIGGQRLFNPGSPTDRRAQPNHTAGLLTLRDARVESHHIVPLD